MQFVSILNDRLCSYRMMELSAIYTYCTTTVSSIQDTVSELNFSPRSPLIGLCKCCIIRVNPNSLRPYHSASGPAAGPTCSKFLAPPLPSAGSATVPPIDDDDDSTALGLFVGLLPTHQMDRLCVAVVQLTALRNFVVHVAGSDSNVTCMTPARATPYDLLTVLPFILLRFWNDPRKRTVPRFKESMFAKVVSVVCAKIESVEWSLMPVFNEVMKSVGMV